MRADLDLTEGIFIQGSNEYIAGLNIIITFGTLPHSFKNSSFYAKKEEMWVEKSQRSILKITSLPYLKNGLKSIADITDRLQNVVSLLAFLLPSV